MVRRRITFEGGSEEFNSCCRRIAGEITRASISYTRPSDTIPSTNIVCTPSYWEQTFLCIYMHRRCIYPEDHPSCKKSSKYVKHACTTMAVTLLNNPTPFRPAHNLQIVANELVQWIRPIWRVATGAQGRSDRRYSQNVREHEQRIVVQTTESKQKLDQASVQLAEANAKIVLLQNRVDELNRQERATRQVSNTALINAMAPQSSPGRGRGSPARGRARGAGTPIRLREEAPPPLHSDSSSSSSDSSTTSDSD